MQSLQPRKITLQTLYLKLGSDFFQVRLNIIKDSFSFFFQAPNSSNIITTKSATTTTDNILTTAVTTKKTSNFVLYDNYFKVFSIEMKLLIFSLSPSKLITATWAAFKITQLETCPF